MRAHAALRVGCYQARRAAASDVRAPHAAWRAALAAIIAAAFLAPTARGDAFPCKGPVTVSSACGAVFAHAAGPGSYVPAPDAECAPCPADGCSCPSSDCLTLVSTCKEPGGDLANIKIGLGGCKYAKTPTGGRDTRIDWVAFQGVDSAGKMHVNHAWLREVANGLPDTSSRCANVAAGNSSSTCCLVRNAQGNGQVNMFKVTCGTRAVVWMGDRTFSSCNSDSPDGPATIPAYVFAGPQPGATGKRSYCFAPSGAPMSQVCGPYTLPPVTCAGLPKC